MIGFAPDQVRACSFWDFLAAAEGYRAANSPEEGPKPPSPEEHDAMLAKYG